MTKEQIKQVYDKADEGRPLFARYCRDGVLWEARITKDYNLVGERLVKGLKTIREDI